MPALLLEEAEIKEVLEKRKEFGSYCWVEVWDGTWVIPPLPDIWHSEMSGLFWIAFYECARAIPGARSGGHVNISDRNTDWMKNVRCPDAVFFRPGNSAKDRKTHWQGSPDLVIEIAISNDLSRDKLGFYASIGTREVLILDRDPWRLELYQLSRGQLRLRGTAAPGGAALASSATPFTFQPVRSRPRPKIKITNTETGQEWVG
jgi:Uma2 family endonuclease